MARAKIPASAQSSATIGFEAKLWLTADKLRNNMDAAEYKHVVLGLIFLKYISDTFRRALIEADREMPSDEMRTPNRGLPTSTFEIHPSNFASLPGQFFYSTQMPVCLWFCGQNNTLDSANDARLFDGETELSLVA